MERCEQLHLHIVSCVESLQVKLPVWLGSPQPKVDCVVGVEPRDWIVIGNCSHLQVFSIQLDTLNSADSA